MLRLGEGVGVADGVDVTAAGEVTAGDVVADGVGPASRVKMHDDRTSVASTSFFTW
jgi:hypothetical protein